MKYTIKPTSRFKKDLKVIQKRGYNLELISEVINILAIGKELSEKYRDHALLGDYSGCRECQYVLTGL